MLPEHWTQHGGRAMDTSSQLVEEYQRDYYIIVETKETFCSEVFTHGAQFAAADEDASFIQHAGVQMQHVRDVHSDQVLGQVPLKIQRVENTVGLFLAHQPLLSLLPQMFMFF